MTESHPLNPTTMAHAQGSAFYDLVNCIRIVENALPPVIGRMSADGRWQPVKNPERAVWDALTWPQKAVIARVVRAAKT